MTIALATEFNSDKLAIDIVGVASAANAGQGSLLNPFGCSVEVLRAFLLTKTNSAGTATLSVGVTTVAASAADVVNAIDVEATTEGKMATGVLEAAAGSEEAPALWTSAKYLTFTASATMVGFTGTLFLEVIRTPAE